MPGSPSAPAVVVGIDGSPAATGAAVWAVGEAASLGVPLKLVHVIHPGEQTGPDADQVAAAAAALSDARRAVETAAAALETVVQVETEVLRGNPLATLIDLSRSAALICVGAIGIAHTCHRAGSTAAALAGSAGCPVAVIRRPDPGEHAHRPSGPIVADVDASPDNNAVLGWAMAEAELRRARLRVITPCAPRSGGPGDDSAVLSRLNRRIGHWARRYPDVTVEPIAVPGDVDRYLADCLAEEAESIQLLVSSTRDRRSLGWAGDTAGCSVLTVGGATL